MATSGTNIFPLNFEAAISIAESKFSLASVLTAPMGN
jgi:hypothetical protein